MIYPFVDSYDYYITSGRKLQIFNIFLNLLTYGYIADILEKGIQPINKTGDGL